MLEEIIPEKGDLALPRFDPNALQIPDYTFTLEIEDVSEPQGRQNLSLSYEDEIDFEAALIVLLRTDGQPFGLTVLTGGPIPLSLLEPRDVFAPAMMAKAAGIILCHLHPTGDVTPSDYDIAFTRQLDRFGKRIGITLYDHLILARRPLQEPEFFSFRDQNLL